MKNVKVVLFPGAPVNVEVEGNETVREVFEKAGLDYIGRELKIDGRAVNEDDLIGNANMLIAMKKIKGNDGYEVGAKLRAFDIDIVKGAYGYNAPLQGEITEIDMEDGILAIDDFYMDIEFVINNYELVKEVAEMDKIEFENTFEEMAREIAKEEIFKSEDLIGLRVERKLEDLRNEKENLLDELLKISEKIQLLESVLN